MSLSRSVFKPNHIVFVDVCGEELPAMVLELDKSIPETDIIRFRVFLIGLNRSVVVKESNLISPELHLEHLARERFKDEMDTIRAHMQCQGFMNNLDNADRHLPELPSQSSFSSMREMIYNRSRQSFIMKRGERPLIPSLVPIVLGGMHVHIDPEIIKEVKDTLRSVYKRNKERLDPSRESERTSKDSTPEPVTTMALAKPSHTPAKRRHSPDTKKSPVKSMKTLSQLVMEPCTYEKLERQTTPEPVASKVPTQPPATPTKRRPSSDMEKTPIKSLDQQVMDVFLRSSPSHSRKQSEARNKSRDGTPSKKPSNAAWSHFR